MTCRVDERVAVCNLERIANELRAVIGLGDGKVSANKVSVRRNSSAVVDFRVVGRNEQNWHDPQPAFQSQRGGDFARNKAKDSSASSAKSSRDRTGKGRQLHVIDLAAHLTTSVTRGSVVSILWHDQRLHLEGIR